MKRKMIKRFVEEIETYNIYVRANCTESAARQWQFIQGSKAMLFECGVDVRITNAPGDGILELFAIGDKKYIYDHVTLTFC